jgi:hypothetical protein
MNHHDAGIDDRTPVAVDMRQYHESTVASSNAPQAMKIVVGFEVPHTVALTMRWVRRVCHSHKFWAS